MTPNYLIIVLIIVVVLFSTIYYLYNSTTKQVKNEPFAGESTPSNPITVTDISTQLMAAFTPESVRYIMVGASRAIAPNNNMLLFNKTEYLGTSYEGIDDGISGVSIDFKTGIISLTPSHTYKVSLIINKLIYNNLTGTSDLDLLLAITSSSNIVTNKMSTIVSLKTITTITLVLDCYLKDTKQIIPQFRPRYAALGNINNLDTGVYLFIERIA